MKCAMNQDFWPHNSMILVELSNTWTGRYRFHYLCAYLHKTLAFILGQFYSLPSVFIHADVNNLRLCQLWRIYGLLMQAIQIVALKWGIWRGNINRWTISGYFLDRWWAKSGEKVGLHTMWFSYVQHIDRLWGECGFSSHKLPTFSLSCQS